jgi:hypothetical protein
MFETSALIAAQKMRNDMSSDYANDVDVDFVRPPH